MATQLSPETMTPEHEGRAVTYVPRHAEGDLSHEDCERGKIMHWNHCGVMVDYSRNQCRTDYKDLYLDF
ncbi:hypothetical protein [Fibrella aestuarina]|nr:hypothetical protein [Fibrella aestuarina]